MSIAGKAGTETPSLANLNEGEKVIFAKIAWRILPLLSLAYIITSSTGTMRALPV